MKPGGEGMQLRQSARELVQQAARAGMQHPGEILHFSPREIETEFRALAARRQRETEQLDLLAWLTGRYVLMAMHVPRRYPHRPDGVLHKKEAMAAADMKRVFAAMAARREEEHGDC